MIIPSISPATNAGNSLLGHSAAGIQGHEYIFIKSLNNAAYVDDGHQSYSYKYEARNAFLRRWQGGTTALPNMQVNEAAIEVVGHLWK
jgi:hypothetical protein